LGARESEIQKEKRSMRELEEVGDWEIKISNEQRREKEKVSHRKRKRMREVERWKKRDRQMTNDEKK
jgi:hypothetical protein